MLVRLAYLGVTNAFALLRLLPGSDRDKDAELLALRHQLAVLQRQLGEQKVRFQPADRALLAALLHRLPRSTLRGLPSLVRPDTILRWHRDLLRHRHAAVSARAGGADRAHCGGSDCWQCAWPGRTPAGDIGGCTVSCSSWE